MDKGYDYNEFDSISLALKEEELDKMLSYYKAFGWQEYERNEDRRYFDIVHIRLIRKHKISNKSKLQLLQVKMEAAVNRFAAVRKNKHSRSICFILTTAVLGAALAFLGLYLSFTLYQSGFKLAPLFSSISLIGVAVPLLLIPKMKALVREEKRVFLAKFKEMTSEISRIISKAKKLYGDNNED